MAVRPKLAETNRYADSGAPSASDAAAQDSHLNASAPRLPSSPIAHAAGDAVEASLATRTNSEPAVSRSCQPGDVIALKYRLDRVLGTGGMGEVWVARNLDLDVDVAIKLLKADASADDSADRLLREARAAARLSDPAIVRVFDFGMSQFGAPYIAMELLEGEDLGRALARRGLLRPTKAVRIILPIIRALSAAHESNIVHRDLKPENIFLAKTASGHIQPKLMDFGIAKLEMSRALRLTHTGTMLGSPLYMSPEHARGDEVDFRGDVWAICVVMYEIMTGNPPFVGKNYNAVIHSIVASEPPPLPGMGIGDEDLWNILQKGMSKSPEQRWGSMSELGRALAEWLLKHDIQDDIVGTSLQAAWIENLGIVRHDPLETMHPPAFNSLDSDVGELVRPAPVATSSDVPEIAVTQPPQRAAVPRSKRGVMLVGVVVTIVLAVAAALVVTKLRNDDVPKPTDSSLTAVKAPVATTSASNVVEPKAAPETTAGSEVEPAPKAAESARIEPSAAPSASAPIKNFRRRTPKKRLKNPFE